MFIETETTPNPATLKFLSGRQVMVAGTREFTNDEEAAASPLAEALFSLGDVTGVLFGRDFISVTAGPGVDWAPLKPQVVAMLLDHFVSEAPLFTGGNAAAITVPGDAADDIGPLQFHSSRSDVDEFNIHRQHAAKIDRRPHHDNVAGAAAAELANAALECGDAAEHHRVVAARPRL